MTGHTNQYHLLHLALGETMAQSLLLVRPNGKVILQVGALVEQAQPLGVLLAQITAAFQHIAGRGKVYRSIFFSYEDEHNRYALISEKDAPFLATIYQSKIHALPPLGLTRFLLQNVYQRLSIAHPPRAQHPFSVEESPPKDETALLTASPRAVISEGDGPPELQTALQEALEATRAALVLAADQSGTVIASVGKMEFDSAHIGALAAASIAALHEVKQLTQATMRNAYALLEGSRYSVLILKETNQPLVFVMAIPRRPGQAIGLGRITLRRLAQRIWPIPTLPTLTDLAQEEELFTEEHDIGLYWNEDPASAQ